jgi:hypothetical protein
MTEYCNLPPSICQCHLCTFQLPRVRSEASSVDRPSKSRRLRYLMDDAPPIWEQSHDQRSAYGTTSLRGLPSTPPSSQGSQRSSKDTHRINSSRSQGPIPRPNRQPEPVGAHRLPSSRGLIMEAGSWCEDRPERHQDMVDDFLLYDEDINARRGMPHCPSPLGRRLATPELAPLCTDFEFCSCCNYDRIACSDRSSRRRAKLDAQGMSVMIPHWPTPLTPLSRRSHELHRRCPVSASPRQSWCVDIENSR